MKVVKKFNLFVEYLLPVENHYFVSYSKKFKKHVYDERIEGK